MNNVGGVLRLLLPGLLLAVLAGPVAAQAPGPAQKALPRRELKPIVCGARRGSLSFGQGVKFERKPSVDEIAEAKAKHQEAPTVPVTDGVRISYISAQCTGCTWIQFLWRQLTIHANKGGDNVYGADHTYRENGADYPYSNDATKPEVHVDAPAATGPAYPGQTLDPTSVEYIDSPGSTFTTPSIPATTDKEKAAKAALELANIKEIEEIAHLDAYLVCDKRVCGHVAWTKTWTWKPGNDAPGTAKNPGVTKYGSMDQEKPTKAMTGALGRQFPGQTLLK